MRPRCSGERRYSNQRAETKESSQNDLHLPNFPPGVPPPTSSKLRRYSLGTPARTEAGQSATAAPRPYGHRTSAEPPASASMQQQAAQQAAQAAQQQLVVAQAAAQQAAQQAQAAQQQARGRWQVFRIVPFPDFLFTILA